MWKWLKAEKYGWSSFYLLLENVSKTAKKQLLSNSIMSVLSTNKGEKSKCTSCNKVHYGKCVKVKNIAAVNKSDKKICPICKKGAHKYKTKAGEENQGLSLN